jgi:hypothetical protein
MALARSWTAKAGRTPRGLFRVAWNIVDNRPLLSCANGEYSGA